MKTTCLVCFEGKERRRKNCSLINYIQSVIKYLIIRQQFHEKVLSEINCKHQNRTLSYGKDSCLQINDSYFGAVFDVQNKTLQQ